MGYVSSLEGIPNQNGKHDFTLQLIFFARYIYIYTSMMSTVYIRKMKKHDDFRYIAEDEAPSVQELISDDVSEPVRKSAIFLDQIAFPGWKRQPPKKFLPTVPVATMFSLFGRFIFNPLNSRLRFEETPSMRPSIQSLVRAQSVDWEPQAPKPEASNRCRIGGWVVGKHPTE